MPDGDHQQFSHQPPDYSCPFCALIAGRSDPVNSQQDVVARTDRALAFVSPRWWPNNHGHVLVVPTTHHENLYALPPADGHAVHDLVREVAVAMRHSYGCDGVSTRQHNEPAGNQDVWHLHVHVFPRYADDHLYRNAPLPGFVSAEQRRPYAERLRAALATA
ncbi:HIT family protein [Microlunatus soli]|uniref:Histidine triad (HIT) family protein n=1 Tax=Microlunatus soli TaxID=630515 RepID=A0A1H2ABJ4_9ACTN|nr:HIT family protein [Microlunatus soli]SDT43257.1 histidine triad (HIT) family protein [Microlunatus soli]